MENKEIDTLKDHRDNTDSSLKFERNKTDNYLDNESKTVEEISDETVAKNREDADKKLKDARVLEDDKRHGHDQTAPLIVAERSRSDIATNVARNEEDKVRTEERDQKKQITQTFLDTERTDTDNKLLCEREGTDEANENISVLVSNAQKALATRDTYLGVLSHDLKNPLTAISLSIETIKRAMDKENFDKKSINKYFVAVERNIKSMGRMIDDLLDVEQMVNGDMRLNFKKSDLNEIVSECKELFEPIAESKSLSINIKPSTSAAFANVDHDRIFQVLSNLVGNAIKFTKEVGVITLAVEKNNNDILVSVQDEGCGIPDEKLDIIFERFSQLNGNDQRGAGLGLFISKWIVESHHGKISVASEIGHGCKFSFTLPCTEILH